MSEWMVTTSSAIVLDESILQLWLLGHSVDQATLQRMQNAQPTVTSRVLKSYIMSQYRTYEMMHHYLHNPRYFAGQFMFPLSQSAKQHLIERYYSFDENVIREILGKKLNSRTRKDLDEVHEKTGVRLTSCRRQFDNLKRIMKRVEDAEGRTLIHDIEHQFLLPRHLASQYAHVLFIADNKLDTFRKRLSVYQFSDFEYCASVFMENWTSTTMDTLPEFDPQLAQDVRDMRSPLLNDRAVMDEFRSRVSNWLSQSAQMANTPLPPVMERIQSQFKVVIRNMLSVGSMINQQKEVRNIFVEITDKLVDAFIQVGWSAMDVELFYDATISEFQNVSSLSSQFRERYGTSWIRLVTGLKLTSIRLFKQPTSQSILQRSFTR
ncbi:fibroblast growth factor intracellular binding protein [Mortierella sp. GBAus27b]|nr:fibroblast growth factor intracellular binding protein [Mortierella sp. GBAus27b]